MNELLRSIPWRSHLPGISVFLVAVLAVTGATLFLFSQQQALQQAEQRFRSQQQMNRQAQDAQQQLATFLEPHRAWLAKGFIGEPQRLQWVEALKALTDELKIPQVQFTLESTQLAEYSDSAYWHEEIPLRLTPMRLELRLAHEGDLLRLLQGLRNRANGLFSVQRCEIRRQDQAGTQSASTNSGLQGYCQLTWYNLDDVTAHWYSLAQEGE